MKKIITVSVLSCLFSLPGVEAAGTGSVNFQGTVTNQTCNATVDGKQSGSFVTLPTVQSSVLSEAGKTAGQTAFNILVTDCLAASPAGAGKVKAYFERYKSTTAQNVDSDGRLLNRAFQGAQNVVLELVDGTSNTPISVASQSQQTNGYVTISNGNATLPYSVRYYATGQATPGYITGEVNYVLMYQ